MLIESDLMRDSPDLIGRVTQMLDVAIPVENRVLLAGSHPAMLTAMHHRRLLPFPYPEGAEPTSSLAAIAQLTALRASGAHFLVFPSTTLWWLDYYADLARFLETNCDLVVDDEETARVYNLQHAPQHDQITRSLRQAIDSFLWTHDRVPSVLDWESTLEIGARLPDVTVFSPLTRADVLPYLSNSIDVVITVDEPARVEEARRVATAAVGVVRVAPNATATLEIDRLAEPTAPGLSASLLLSATERHDFGRMTLLGESLPDELAGDVILVGTSSAREFSTVRTVPVERVEGDEVAALNRAAELARGDILVFVPADILPLEGWLVPLLRTFRAYPEAGVVGGKLITSGGTLQSAGVLLGPDGSVPLGREADVESPSYNFVRAVDYHATGFLATRRDLFFALGGFSSSARPWRDYCLAAAERGAAVLYQPKMAGISLPPKDKPQCP